MRILRLLFDWRLCTTTVWLWAPSWRRLLLRQLLRWRLKYYQSTVQQQLPTIRSDNNQSHTSELNTTTQAATFFEDAQTRLLRCPRSCSDCASRRRGRWQPGDGWRWLQVTRVQTPVLNPSVSKSAEKSSQEESKSNQTAEEKAATTKKFACSASKIHFLTGEIAFI